MTRRSWLIAILALIGTAAIVGVALRPQARQSIKIGYAVSLSGANAAGVMNTILPNYRLWAREVNEAGGIMLKSIGKRLPVEIIEYDDQSRTDQNLSLIDRLIHQDKADFILSPWGTGMNLAAGPLFHRAGYPHLVATGMTDHSDALSRLWPNSFWFTRTMTEAAQALVTGMARLRTEGRTGNRVAMVNVADQFGIELARAGRRALMAEGFAIVYDRAYPVGEEDMREIIAEAKRLDPDFFLAFSYPPDTMAITEEARRARFNPKLFYTAIGTAFPTFKKRFGADVEGVMGTGGWDPDSASSKDYRRRHLEASGQEPDRWASTMAYASLQMLQQAIERAGRVDRPAVIKQLQSGTFQTILGDVKLDHNMYPGGWLAGQWQHGEYHGVAPAALPGAKPILFPKPEWGTTP